MEKVLRVCLANSSRSPMMQAGLQRRLGGDFQVESAGVGDASTTIVVANAENGGIPDPYEFGLQGYRDCLALLDVVMPEITRKITSA